MGDDYKEMAHILELQAEAIKGMAAIAEYMAASKDINKEARRFAYITGVVV